MSRIGKLPVTIPNGVKVQVQGTQVLVEGPKGKLTYQPTANVKVEIADGKVVVSRVGADRQAAADYGTTRAKINCMVLGVSQGWKKTLELNGVGFNAKLQGKNLVLNVGFSHEVSLPLPESLKCTITKNVVEFEATDKEIVGGFAAKVRQVQPPEPYLGKGIKYSDEVIRRKAGKTAAKK